MAFASAIFLASAGNYRGFIAVRRTDILRKRARAELRDHFL